MENRAVEEVTPPQDTSLALAAIERVADTAELALRGAVSRYTHTRAD